MDKVCCRATIPSPLRVGVDVSFDRKGTRDCVCDSICTGEIFPEMSQYVRFPELVPGEDYTIMSTDKSKPMTIDYRTLEPIVPKETWLPPNSPDQYRDSDNPMDCWKKREDVEILSSGATQCKEVEGYVHISQHALKLLAAVRKYGVDRYGPTNHLGIPIESHLDHAIAHIYKFHNRVPSEHNLLGDDSHVEHLGHALCRLTMAIDVFVKDLESSIEAGDRGG